jgi:hypothetical protein
MSYSERASLPWDTSGRPRVSPGPGSAAWPQTPSAQSLHPKHRTRRVAVTEVQIIHK